MFTQKLCNSNLKTFLFYRLTFYQSKTAPPLFLDISFAETDISIFIQFSLEREYKVTSKKLVKLARRLDSPFHQ